MRKKNLFKKLIAAAGAMAMALTLMVPMGVSAASNTYPSDGSTGSLTITKYVSDAGAGNWGTQGNIPEDAKPLGGVTFSIRKVGNIVQESYGDPDEKIGLLYQITDTGLQNELKEQGVSPDSEENKYTSATLDAALQTYTKELEALVTSGTQGTDYQSETTSSEEGDGKGKAVFNNLPMGIYLVAETGVPANVTKKSVPFFVSIPSAVNGEGVNTQWELNVNAYPKNSTAQTSVDKNITGVTSGKINANKDAAEASIGDVITYEVPVTAVIPADGLTYLGIKDTMSKGLTLINRSNEEVNVTDSETGVTEVVDVYEGTTTTSGTKLTENTDYTVKASKDSDGNTILKVKLSDNKVIDLNNKAESDNTPQFLFVYKAKLNENAVAGSVTTGNSVKLVYDYTNHPDGDIEFGTDIDTTIYTWGIEITKQSDTGEELDGVTFELYKDSPEGAALKFRQINSGENNGVYYLDNTAGNSRLTTSNGGKLVIHGLASGTYYLKETKTNSGYVLLKDPVKIVISPDSEFDGATTAKIGNNESSVNQNEDDRFEVTVVNNKGFDLPQTGAAGTALFAIVGMAIAAVAGGLLFFLRRSSKK